MPIMDFLFEGIIPLAAVCTCMCTYFLIILYDVWLHFLPFNFVLDNSVRKKTLNNCIWSTIIYCIYSQRVGVVRFLRRSFNVILVCRIFIKEIVIAVLLLVTICFQEEVVHFIQHLELSTLHLLTCHTPTENFVCNFCNDIETLTFTYLYMHVHRPLIVT